MESIYVVMYKEQMLKARIVSIHKTAKGVQERAEENNENRLYENDKYFVGIWTLEK